MTISCQIHLYDHPNNVYVAGDKVHGFVRYTLSEETKCKGLTVSLKGHGSLHMRWTCRRGKENEVKHYNNWETYVHIDQISNDFKEDTPIPEGTYDIPFAFTLPHNIPPSYEFHNHVSYYGTLYQVSTRIIYYVRLKFERPGMLNFTKRFKTQIIVAGCPSPTLSQTPVMQGIEKKPFHIFKKNGILTVKGTLDNPVTMPGGVMKLNYEVNNDTKLNLERITMIVTEETTFIKTIQSVVDVKTIVSYVADKVKSGENQAREVIISIPRNAITMRHSNLVVRNYFVSVVATLPMPHRNAFIKIPIEIIQPMDFSPETVIYDDLPPSYSEVMAEYKKEDLSEEVNFD